ncbi:hypothetical protein CHLNCDRAFT_140170 [Chlorella variabilis]|uniref:FHA domain-containing protein n=1 Tax=Chlorella variabilis TaxID=554065 RepID=E1ZRP1_CHLVA|nr:hypothetical protein CHLNCDRAFT_140170 [Chlorella variabilis]EFN51446.1 hypothetical protein CHLNCDRAFT_140170 [Chlorella variabilis]|eukprot:XP_005843548.1 hypothetical protein CHLNCDRAFT_140170 [Chlorella variabilis]
MLASIAAPCPAAYLHPKALQLTPTGDGTQQHLDAEVAIPGAIKLQEGLFELGRAPPADILIEIPTVSTRHATLRVGEASVIVTDLGSTNGTTIDGEELEATQAAELKPGSEIVFGDKYIAKFRLDVVEDAPPPAEAPAAKEAVPAAAEEKAE